MKIFNFKNILEICPNLFVCIVDFVVGLNVEDERHLKSSPRDRSGIVLSRGSVMSVFGLRA